MSTSWCQRQTRAKWWLVNLRTMPPSSSAIVSWVLRRADQETGLSDMDCVIVCNVPCLYTSELLWFHVCTNDYQLSFWLLVSMYWLGWAAVSCIRVWCEKWQETTAMPAEITSFFLFLFLFSMNFFISMTSVWLGEPTFLGYIKFQLYPTFC